MDLYKGPIDYVIHHEVYKYSNTTPVRLVSDSSFKNGDISLNEILIKGLNTVADIYNNLVKFRSYQVRLMYDLTKAYNCLLTRMIERHKRSLWMRCSQDEEW